MPSGGVARPRGGQRWNEGGPLTAPHGSISPPFAHTQTGPKPLRSVAASTPRKVGRGGGFWVGMRLPDNAFGVAPCLGPGPVRHLSWAVVCGGFAVPSTGRLPTPESLLTVQGGGVLESLSRRNEARRIAAVAALGGGGAVLLRTGPSRYPSPPPPPGGPPQRGVRGGVRGERDRVGGLQALRDPQVLQGAHRPEQQHRRRGPPRPDPPPARLRFLIPRTPQLTSPAPVPPYARN